MNEHPNAAIIRSAYEAMEGQEGAGARVGQTGRHTFERATPVRGYFMSSATARVGRRLG